jgi:3-oxoacyl-[acyl-carrier protein] reductase
MVALITGVTRGIGRSVCLGLAAKGYTPAFVARESQHLDSLLEQLPTKPVLVKGDLRQAEDVLKLNETLLNSTGLPDVFVLNAGIFDGGFPTETDQAAIEKMLQENFWQAFNTLKFWLPEMKKQRRGKVIVIGSIVTKAPRANATAYTLAKTMLDTWASLLADEMRDFGVSITRIIPGSVNTSSWDGMDVPKSDFVQPEDVAKMIETLLEQPANCWTEEIIIRPIDKNW